MPKKILLVDDDSALVTLVGVKLKRAGYEVVTAFDGEEGLQKAKTEKPDLIILDIMMPKLDGQQVLDRLKQSEETKDISVIMLTSKDDPKDIIKSVAGAGAVDYIVKPYIASDFLKKINSKFASDKKVSEDSYDEDLLNVIEKKIKKIIE